MKRPSYKEPPSAYSAKKEALCHTHKQGLAKTARTGNQGHVILIFPSFFYKHGFVHIEVIVYYDFLKILFLDSNRPCHRRIPPTLIILRFSVMKS